MLHSINGSSEMRQQGQNDPQFHHVLMNVHDQSLNDLVTRAIKPDPSFGTDALSFVPNGEPAFGLNYGISRTTSCPPSMLDSAVSNKKRKADKNQHLKEETKDKKMKECTGEEGSSKVKIKEKSNNSRQNSDTSKEKSKIAQHKKLDYIHVRARRGQATDSHSLAERVRREKISKRKRFLQDLVPGCNKITGEAGMLDEIINYVQSLQRQVEFLSMKLATVNPRLDIDIHNLFNKEIIAASTSEMHRHFNSLGFDMGILNLGEMALRRIISAPVPHPDTFLDSSSINQVHSFPTWDPELENLYGMELQQGRSVQFFPNQFTGFAEAGNDLKMEM